MSGQCPNTGIGIGAALLDRCHAAVKRVALGRLTFPQRGGNAEHLRCAYDANDPQELGKECAVTNPFEDPDAKYIVVVNDEGQYSLWPVFADVPDGWQLAFGEDGREECLDYIEKNWTDMRPTSLIRAMEGARDAAAK